MVGPAGSCLGMDNSLLLVQMHGEASGFEQKELMNGVCILGDGESLVSDSIHTSSDQDAGGS